LKSRPKKRRLVQKESAKKASKFKSAEMIEDSDEDVEGAKQVASSRESSAALTPAPGTDGEDEDVRNGESSGAKLARREKKKRVIDDDEEED